MLTSFDDKINKLNENEGHVAALLRSHMIGLLPFEGTIEQRRETMPSNPKTIRASTMIKQ